MLMGLDKPANTFLEYYENAVTKAQTLLPLDKDVLASLRD